MRARATRLRLPLPKFEDREEAAISAAILSFRELLVGLGATPGEIREFKELLTIYNEAVFSKVRRIVRESGE